MSKNKEKIEIRINKLTVQKIIDTTRVVKNTQKMEGIV